MPNARIEYRKIGDIWDKVWALLAWKLSSKGLVVDEGVVINGVVGGSLGVYRTIKGGDHKCTAHNIKQLKYMAMIAIQITDIAKRYTIGVLLQSYTLQTNREFNR